MTYVISSHYYTLDLLYEIYFYNLLKVISLNWTCIIIPIRIWLFIFIKTFCWYIYFTSTCIWTKHIITSLRWRQWFAVYIFKIWATTKCILFNLSNTLRYGDAFKCTLIKCKLFNCSNILRNIYTNKIFTSVVFTTDYYSIFYR